MSSSERPLRRNRCSTGVAACTGANQSGATWSSFSSGWGGDQQSFVLPYEIFKGTPGNPGGFDLVKYAQDFKAAQAILLDAHVEGYGGGGKTFNWSLLPPNVNAHLVLSGGLSPANVGDGIRALRPRCKTLAVDVSSGVEASKGIKDAGKIREFIAAVRAADSST